jgi:hypothetical protein
MIKDEAEGRYISDLLALGAAKQLFLMVFF